MTFVLDWYEDVSLNLNQRFVMKGKLHNEFCLWRVTKILDDHYKCMLLFVVSDIHASGLGPPSGAIYMHISRTDSSMKLIIVDMNQSIPTVDYELFKEHVLIPEHLHSHEAIDYIKRIQ